jgi:hypothetical protein
MLDKFRKIGLSDVHEQSMDLPPQWSAHGVVGHGFGGRKIRVA